MFEDLVESYYLDSQIKDDFQCDQDCYIQYSELTKDDHPNICTHDYQHIAQNIDDLSNDTQQNNLYSTKESMSSFIDNSDYETVSDKTKYDESMKNHDPKDVGTKDVVLYKRDNGIPTKDKRPIETRDIDDDFMREYDEMHKSMEYKQIYDYYEAQRHIQSAMEGDTPVKTGQNRQCIDNVRDYDREHDRILNSVCHRLDLGPNMLPGAQQHTTVESAAALRIQDKTKGKYDENIDNVHGQHRNELHKRAEIWYLN